VARWLEGRPGDQDETVGYHLGEAYRQLAELGVVGEHERALAGAAAKRLVAAGDTALLRGDSPGGARLLERAESLLESDDAARAELLPALGASLFEAGRMTDAARVLDDAIALAPGPRLQARAQVERELVRLETETGAGTDQERRVTDAVLPLLEREGDDYGQSRAWLLRGQVAWFSGRAESADEAWREAAESARRAGDQRELFEVIGYRALAAVLGPLPVDEAIRRCEEFGELVRASPLATALARNPLAYLHAAKGELDVAEGLLEWASETLRELGGVRAGASHVEGWLRLLAGQPELAEARLRADVETLSSMGEGGALATTTALLAQAVFAQGRLAEAGELCRTAERIGAAEDTMTQPIWRGVQAKILAREGRCQEAEELAREAVALLEPTDLLSHRGDAMLDLADVLRTCARTEEADRVTRAGLALYELKGNATAAARAQLLLNDPPGGT
jgi:tetratricopeptide (TPR) repeat protein